MKSLFVRLQYLLPHHGISRLAGVLANCRWKWVRQPFIYLFIRYFKVDLGEAQIQDYGQFEHFNAFFTRALLPECRPLPAQPEFLVSPADGTVSQLGRLEDDRLLQAKGIDYSLLDLLGGDPGDAAAFRAGDFVTIYLSPRDYHRVHMPADGVLQKTIYVPGRLFSVNQRTTEQVDGLFTRNERLVCFFDTPAGPLAMVLVGAMIVAGIETAWSGRVRPGRHRLVTPGRTDDSAQVSLDRGAEMGRFMLGSTVILVFPAGAVALDRALRAGSAIRQGQKIASPGDGEFVRR